MEVDYEDVEYDEEDFVGAEDLFSSDSESEAKEENVPPDEEAKEVPEKPKKVRKSFTRSRHKLDDKTLGGPNGLSLLKKSFKNFKFKGDGHEHEDLTRIMKILKHWMCYQLFPKYNFETTMAELEHLGSKKIVQVQMQKMRMGIDTWGQQQQNIEEDNVESKEEEPKNNFDDWWREEMAKISSGDEMEADEIQNERRQQEKSRPDGEVTSEQQEKSQPEVTLTAEQLERIARNRKLAEERRQMRLQNESTSQEK
ncbi:hypothetical protein RUM44_011154 [Polyplax serrata]|uniref:TIMELESS-interacting protein n=1 Tax=Polyplax serrata TaxID=468196 RepID=A0ABR1AP83_POLSC